MTNNVDVGVKKKRGGVRIGAGRKRTGQKICLVLTAEEIDRAKAIGEGSLVDGIKGTIRLFETDQLPWVQNMHGIKIRHSFEIYHRSKYGCYPSWDANLSEYLVCSTQEKWTHWKSFFQSSHKDGLEVIPHQQMADLYLSVENSEPRQGFNY
jgi:hypothetical protein